MSDTHGKTPSIIPDPWKGYSSPIPGWQMNGPAGRELHCPTGFIPRPHSDFGEAKARVLRPWSRDLPSCHLCHRFHACLSHPETEHKDNEMISKFPVPPKHQREMVQKQSLTLAPLAPLEPCGGNERGVRYPSRTGLSPSALQSPHQLSLRHSAQLCTPLGPAGSPLLAQAVPAGGVDVGAHSRLQHMQLQGQPWITMRGDTGISPKHPC